MRTATVFRRVESGEVVYHEGEPANALFLVLSGLLEVRSTRFKTVEQHPRFFPGSFFGELSLLYDRPRTATVTALVSSTLARLRRDFLEELMTRQPTIRRASRSRPAAVSSTRRAPGRPGSGPLTPGHAGWSRPR